MGYKLPKRLYLPSHRIHHVIWHLAVIFLIALLSIWALFVLWLPYYTRQHAYRSIPMLKGLATEEAIRRLSSAGFRFQIQDTIYHNEYPLGVVLDQTPAAGQLAKAGRRIHLLINSPDVPQLPLPPLIGTSLHQALQRLKQQGIHHVRIRYQATQETAMNNVLGYASTRGTSLQPGSPFRISDTLVLLVSEPPEHSIEVPQLMGLSEEEARFVVLAVGLRIGHVEYVFDQPQDMLGIVVRQSPLPFQWQAGKKVRNHLPKGSYIDLWVAGMPAAEAEP